MSRYFIAFWNLENLFAPEGFPSRPPWLADRLAGDLKGWSEVLFAKKVDQLAKLVSQMNDGQGPDLLGVCEVENAFALGKFSSALNVRLPGRTYDIVHVDSERDQRGIDTAFIFDTRRLSVDREKVFSHFVMRRTGTRDITQATFTTLEGRELVALANHWPSRSGGHAVESQGFRMTAGETLGYWHERIREVKGVDAAVLAFGDLNDDPGDQSVMVHANATRERDDVEGAKSARFYNLAWSYMRQRVTTVANKPRTLYGTLYFKGDANIFDQILVSPSLLTGKSGLTVIDNTARIEAFPEMVSAGKNEGPIRFGLPKGDAARNITEAGFSDHFPVSVMIEAEPATS